MDDESEYEIVTLERQREYEDSLAHIDSFFGRTEEFERDTLDPAFQYYDEGAEVIRAVEKDPYEGIFALWTPQEGSQQIFMKDTTFEVLYEGTRGPGKTDALLMDFAQHVDKGHGAAWKGILFRQTFPQLQDVVSKSKKWFSEMFPDAKFNEAKYVWSWPTGEQLLLRQFMRDDDYWNFHGHEYPWIGWEELCNWPTSTGYRRMMSCCRTSEPGVPRKYRATTNPYGPGHNWVKRRWKLPGHRGILISGEHDENGNPEPDRIAHFGALYENKVLIASDPDYIKRVIASARNDAELRAWRDGSWDIVAGGMFDDVWDTRYHVLKPFVIPASWRIDRSFDWGSSKPFSVGWWAESDGTDYKSEDGKIHSTVRGDLFRIHEWYGCRPGAVNEGTRMLAVDIANGIVERELAWGIRERCRGGPADTSIFDAENGVCIATDMAKPVRLNGMIHRGVQWDRADKSPGSRKTGWEAMRKMLKAGMPNKDRTPRENAGLFFFSSCMEAVSQLPVLPRDDKKLDDVNTEAEDHIADETRYRVRASGSRVTQSKLIGAY